MNNPSAPTVTPTESPLPTDTPTESPVPTDTPTESPLPTDTPTESPVPTDTPTESPAPAETATQTPLPTDTPTESSVPTDTPTESPVPTETATLSPLPTDTPTASPVATATPTDSPLPTETATESPPPTETPTSSPLPSETTPSPTAVDADVTGCIYDELTGELVTGGMIEVSGPGNVTIHEDGSTGCYSFSTEGTEGTYTITFKPPPVAESSVSCLPEPGLLDPTGAPPPCEGDPNLCILGAHPSGSELADPECEQNPYFLQLQLEEGDPDVLNNNIPVVLQIDPSFPAPALSSRALLAAILSLAGLGLLGVRRATMEGRSSSAGHRQRTRPPTVV